jgi:hypothetical protein
VIYQVQYKINSMTYVDDYEANSHDDIRNLFDDLTSCEVIEIRKYKYEGLAPSPIDDNNYVSSVKFNLGVKDGFNHNFRMPKVRKTLNDSDYVSLAYEHLEVKGSKIDYVNTDITYSF